VHTKLGSGLLEKVYCECLAFELTKAGLSVEQEVGIPVNYETAKLDCGYRIDILVNKKVLIELNLLKISLLNIRHKTFNIIVALKRTFRDC